MGPVLFFWKGVTVADLKCPEARDVLIKWVRRKGTRSDLTDWKRVQGIGSREQMAGRLEGLGSCWG